MLNVPSLVPDTSSLDSYPSRSFPWVAISTSVAACGKNDALHVLGGIGQD